jgi:hypothetical protein
MEAHWIERLNSAASDQVIAQEVLAASFAGRQASLEQYARSELESGHPVRIARALMVLGYSDRSTFADQELERFRGSKGMIGAAAEAAIAAYERNLWSRHWFTEANAANEPIQFWRAAIILGKIVDGRFALWQSESAERKGSVMTRFGWTLDDPVGRRTTAWDKKRADTLFGSKRPREIYLSTPV